MDRSRQPRHSPTGKAKQSSSPSRRSRCQHRERPPPLSPSSPHSSNTNSNPWANTPVVISSTHATTGHYRHPAFDGSNSKSPLVSPVRSPLSSDGPLTGVEQPSPSSLLPLPIQSCSTNDKTLQAVARLQIGSTPGDNERGVKVEDDDDAVDIREQQARVSRILATVQTPLEDDNDEKELRLNRHYCRGNNDQVDPDDITVTHTNTGDITTGGGSKNTKPGVAEDWTVEDDGRAVPVACRGAASLLNEVHESLWRQSPELYSHDMSDDVLSASRGRRHRNWHRLQQQWNVTASSTVLSMPSVSPSDNNIEQILSFPRSNHMLTANSNLSDFTNTVPAVAAAAAVPFDVAAAASTAIAATLMAHDEEDSNAQQDLADDPVLSMHSPSPSDNNVEQILSQRTATAQRIMSDDEEEEASSRNSMPHAISVFTKPSTAHDLDMLCHEATGGAAEDDALILMPELPEAPAATADPLIEVSFDLSAIVEVVVERLPSGGLKLQTGPPTDGEQDETSSDIRNARATLPTTEIQHDGSESVHSDKAPSSEPIACSWAGTNNNGNNDCTNESTADRGADGDDHRAGSDHHVERIFDEVCEERWEPEIILDDVTRRPSHLPIPAIVPEHPFAILGEIVGAYRLSNRSAIGDNKYSFSDEDLYSDLRPHAVVTWDGKIIHRTRRALEAGPNPVWVFSTRSLWTWSVTPRALADLAASESATKQGAGQRPLQVSLFNKHKDPLQLTTLDTVCMGTASISVQELLQHCNEERWDVSIRDVSGQAQGHLTLRFRLATLSDLRFLRPELRRQVERPDLMYFLAQAEDASARQASLTNIHKTPTPEEQESRTPLPLVSEADTAQIAGANFVQAVSNAFDFRPFYETLSWNSGPQPLVRIKPGPDPERSADTTYMAPHEIHDETFKPSKSWVEAGSGGLGNLFVEILACKDLPNVDLGEAVGNVTDPFICVVYEDTMVQTPVIDDELSPHWMPWTQRAFRFAMMHPASMLYIGAFDCDVGIRGHDPLGRVAVNISNLQRDTNYTLRYNLYPSSNVKDRTAMGSITMRLRIEYTDERAAVLAALKPRPKFHVNVRKEASLKIVRYTCFGDDGDSTQESFDLSVMRAYINELVECKTAFQYCLGDACRSLILWRGQVKVGDAMVPIHSFLLFWAGTVLVEHPQLFPSFVFLSIAWLMLAVQQQRRQHPSPWHRCPSFWRYVDALRSGKSSIRVPYINAHEGAEAAKAYDQQWKCRIEKDQVVAATRADLQAQITALGNDSIQTKIDSHGIPIEMWDRLGRIQRRIGEVCRLCRFIKIIATWEECIVSFWISACFLIIGVVSLLLPWSFILLWTGRLFVYCVLGPHMKLVDILFVSAKTEDDTAQTLFAKFKRDSRVARERKQEADKLKDMKCVSFGSYITLVPNYNLSRHYDHPLPSSYASLHQASDNDARLSTKYYMPGQQLFGSMIPRPHALAKKHDDEAVLTTGVLREVKQYVAQNVEREISKGLKVEHDKSNQFHVKTEQEVPETFTAGPLGQEHAQCQTDQHNADLKPFDELLNGVQQYFAAFRNAADAAPTAPLGEALSTGGPQSETDAPIHERTDESWPQEPDGRVVLSSSMIVGDGMVEDQHGNNGTSSVLPAINTQNSVETSNTSCDESAKVDNVATHNDRIVMGHESKIGDRELSGDDDQRFLIEVDAELESTDSIDIMVGADATTPPSSRSMDHASFLSQSTRASNKPDLLDRWRPASMRSTVAVPATWPQKPSLTVQTVRNRPDLSIQAFPSSSMPECRDDDQGVEVLLSPYAAAAAADDDDISPGLMPDERPSDENMTEVLYYRPMSENERIVRDFMADLDLDDTPISSMADPVTALRASHSSITTTALSHVISQQPSDERNANRNERQCV